MGEVVGVNFALGFFSLFLSLEKEKIDGYRVDSLDIMDYLLIVIVYYWLKVPNFWRWRKIIWKSIYKNN